MMGTRSSIGKRAKVVGQLCVKSPFIPIVPLLLLGLLLGLGLWGVKEAEKQRADNNRQVAMYDALATSQALSSDMYQAVMPALQLGQMARHYPDVNKFLQIWDTVADSIWEAAPSGALSITAVVMGVMKRNYYGLGAPTDPRNTAPSLNKDLLLPNSPYRSVVLAGIAARNVSLQGPFESGGLSIASFSVPVFIANVSSNEPWGGGYDYSNCPVGLCYHPGTRSKWWGQVGLSMDANVWFHNSRPVNVLVQKGYRMLASRAGIPQLGEASQVTIYKTSDVSQVPGDAVQLPVSALNQQWQVSVWRDGGWHEDLGYLYAVVVIGSVIISALLFIVLLSWVEHKALLYSLLPEHTIKRLQSEAHWAVKHDDDLNALRLETPAQGLIHVINTCIDGGTPPLARLLPLKDALQCSVDVYRPTADTVKNTMARTEFVDAEVQQALARQLDIASSDSSITSGMDDCPPGLATKKGAEDTVAACQGSESVHLTFQGPAAYILDIVHTLTQSLAPAPRASGALLPVVQESADEQEPSEEEEQDGTGTTDADKDGPRLALLTQLEQVLATANNWSFDAYALEEASQGYPLSVLGYWLMHSTGLISWARMDAMKLVRFLQRVEDGYSSYNPYHNKRHAADVLQSMHVIMHRGGLLPGFVDHTSMLACYLCYTSITRYLTTSRHDYEHKGRNNDYLVNAYDELAVRYNDRSPMENHHLAAAFGVLRQPDCDCLAGLSKATFNKIRKLMIELVLATDMKQHFAIVGQFDALQTTEDDASRTSRPSRSSLDKSSVAENQSLVPTSESDRLLSLQMAFKCADLGHLTAPLNVHLRWVGALEQQFFIQGDAEKAQGLPVSPLCDRTKEGVYKSQVGFITVVVMPLFKAFTRRFPSSAAMVKALIANQQHWQMQAAQNKQMSSGSHDSRGSRPTATV